MNIRKKHPNHLLLKELATPYPKRYFTIFCSKKPCIHHEATKITKFQEIIINIILFPSHDFFVSFVVNINLG